VGDGAAERLTRVGDQIAGHLRESVALDAARPQWAAGLRAATAMAVPLLLGWIFHRPELLWSGLGGWLTMVADPGGPYRARAAALATFAAAGSLATLLGGLAGQSPWVGAPALFLFALLCSLVRVRGDTAASIGVLSLIEFCITQGSPAGFAQGAFRAEMFAAGALFAILLAIAVWPFRPYYPVRMAVASAWTVLGELAEAAARLSTSAPEPLAWDALVPVRRRAREALERARAALGLARAGHQGETGRGVQLLVLYEIAELLLGDLAALIEALRARVERNQPIPAPASEALARLGAAQHALALAVAQEARTPPLQLPEAPAEGDLGPLFERVRAEVGQALESTLALERVGDMMSRAAAIRVPRKGTGPPAPGPLAPPDELPALRDVLSPASAELRHALRVAIVATAAQLLAGALHLERSYWVTVTAIIVLQPHAVNTVRRAVQRVGGTVIGGIAAALIARFVHRGPVLLPLLFVMASAGVALRRINYAVFAALVTPVFVLLAEVNAGSAHLTVARILDTVLGGALALLGAMLLWPTRDLERMPSLIAAVLRANQAYLEAVLGGKPPAAVVAARRRIGLATANAEAALQRLIGEAAPAARVQPVMTLVAYARRLSASITALASAPPDPAHAAALEQALRALADAAQAGAAPPPLPRLEQGTEPAQRLGRQLRVVHSALARLTG
jgi:uncharacterized membrane protein YccC